MKTVFKIIVASWAIYSILFLFLNSPIDVVENTTGEDIYYMTGMIRDDHERKIKILKDRGYQLDKKFIGSLKDNPHVSDLTIEVSDEIFDNTDKKTPKIPGLKSVKVNFDVDKKTTATAYFLVKEKLFFPVEGVMSVFPRMVGVIKLKITRDGYTLYESDADAILAKVFLFSAVAKNQNDIYSAIKEITKNGELVANKQLVANYLTAKAAREMKIQAHIGEWEPNPGLTESENKEDLGKLIAAAEAHFPEIPEPKPVKFLD